MAKRSPTRRGEIVGRVTREFKHGGLEPSQGGKLRNPRQAIAIALHEAGASRDETPARNRRNLAHKEGQKGRDGAGRMGDAKKAPAAARSDGAGQTRAALRGEATKRGIPGRSRMVRDQLAKPLGRRR